MFRANVAAFLLRHSVSTDKKLKIEEYCIKPKNSLFILGTLAENPGFEVGPNPIQSSGLHQYKLKLNLSATVGSTNRAVLPSLHSRITKSCAFQVQISRSNAADMTQQGKIAAALVKAGISNPCGLERSRNRGQDGSRTAPEQRPRLAWLPRILILIPLRC